MIKAITLAMSAINLVIANSCQQNLWPVLTKETLENEIRCNLVDQENQQLITSGSLIYDAKSEK